MRSAFQVTAVIVTLAVVGGLGWLVYQKLQTKGGPPERPKGVVAVPVEVSAVQTDTIRDVRVWTGTIEPRAKFIVAPKIAGRLKSLKVNIGDRVTQTDPIAYLDDEELQQAVVQAEAEKTVAEAAVEEIEKTLAAAKREYERVKMLHEQGIASDSDLDVALAPYEAQQGKLKVANAQVTLKSAAVEAAEIRKKYAAVKPSWEGGPEEWIVGEKFANEGDTLAANAPIVSVLDIQKVIAVINVTDRDYTRLSQGQTARIRSDACPDETFSGSITRLAPLFRETSRQARVEIETPNTGLLLKPGMFVRVTIELGRSDQATIVPLSAIARRDGRQGVFVVEEAAKKAKFIPVTIGITEGERVEIKSPKLSGKVITLGQHLLEEGTPIRVVDVPLRRPESKEPATKAADQGKNQPKSGKTEGP